MRVDVIYTKIPQSHSAKPNPLVTRAGGRRGGQTDAKHCVGRYSSEHLIPLNQHQPLFLYAGPAEMWPADLVHPLFVSVLVGRVGTSYGWQKIVSLLRKEMCFPSNKRVHVYHRSFLNRDPVWEIHVHHLAVV